MKRKSSQKVNKLYVVGIGYSPLSNRVLEIIRESRVVLANNRLMELVRKYEVFESLKTIKIINSVYETMDYIRTHHDKPGAGTITLLASGDPLFFGIGRMVVKEFDKEEVEILPDLSSIQLAFAKIKEPWNEALLMSLHGGVDTEKPEKRNFIIDDIPVLLKKHNKIGILTDKVNSPSAIAQTINSSHICCDMSLKIFVCEKLGYEDERITGGAPEEIYNSSSDHLNVVIIVRNEEPRTKNKEGEGRSAVSSQLSEIIFGLKETEIQHSRSLITKDEVRAVTIHKLRLQESGVFWDIGAGSGSISIEAGRLCPDMEIIAVERNEEQIGHINSNIRAFKIGNIHVVKGEAPQVLTGLPAPDRVFIGGSGKRLDEIVSLISEKMDKGIVVINATTIETLNNALQFLEKNGFQTDVTEVSVSRSKLINQKRHMSALNPIFIIKGGK